MDKTIISVAVVGSGPTKDMNPAVPYTPKEIADAAIECHKAGAAITHIHVRDPETGIVCSRIELFKEVVDRIRQACDIAINLTTSGGNIKGENIIEERLEPVTLKPEICSLDIGSVDFWQSGVYESTRLGCCCGKAHARASRQAGDRGFRCRSYPPGAVYD